MFFDFFSIDFYKIRYLGLKKGYLQEKFTIACFLFFTRFGPFGIELHRGGGIFTLSRNQYSFVDTGHI